jgi:DNA-directed RNA polymerase specialized sigma24 family protein
MTDAATDAPDPGGSVIALIGALRAGDRAAADALWAGYFARMAALARKRLVRAPRAVADEEDVALSAFLSFCRAPGDPARTPAMTRAKLWSLLATITANKAARHVARETRLKRGGGYQRRPADDLDGVAAAGPPPDAVTAAADEVRHLIDGLADPDLQAVALLRMEGYATAEIAAELGCAPRTVERRLQVIRCLLAEGGAGP